MNFELDFTKKEYELILDLMNNNADMHNKSKKHLNEIRKQGWWTAPELQKKGKMNSSSQNIHHYANKLIKKNIIQKKEIPYTDAYNRKKSKIMIRLNPDPILKSKLYNLIDLKQTKLFNETKIGGNYKYFPLLQSDYFNNGKNPDSWLLKAIEARIEELEKYLKHSKGLYKVIKLEGI